MSVVHIIDNKINITKEIQKEIQEHNKNKDSHNGAELNVQSDWNVIDVNSDAFINNKPASLPANGGNADTVDGKHATEFLLKPGLDFSSYTDWNLITEPGIYSLMNDLTLNSPTVSYFYPIVFRYGTNTTQIAVPYYFRDSKVYIRNHFGGSWGVWRNIGDGCNADTVDGKHASDLQNYNNLTNKPASLPANGGNADTVDGKHAADFQKFFTYNTTVDFNSLIETGVYSILAGENKNAPSTYWGTLIVQTTGRVRQIWYADHGSDIYTREKAPTGWLDWTKVNDGGNADTVDGKHADNFIQNKGVLHNADVNTVKEPGEYYLQNGLNLPESGSGFLKVEPGYDKNYVKQTYIKYNSPITYERKLVANVWQAWIKTNTIVTCSNTAPTAFIGHDNQHQVY